MNCDSNITVKHFCVTRAKQTNKIDNENKLNKIVTGTNNTNVYDKRKLLLETSRLVPLVWKMTVLCGFPLNRSRVSFQLHFPLIKSQSLHVCN